jgi:V8-like Glu-specific endopeptidase
MRSELRSCVFRCTGVFIVLCSGCVAPSNSGAEQAVVALTSNGRFFCSGTVIAPETILSAAHCLTLGGGGAYDVHPEGSADLWSGGVRVVRKYRHPEYDSGTFAHDVAIFRLAAPLSGVTPLPLHRDSFRDADLGHEVRHIGFIKTRESWARSEVRSRIRSMAEFHVESGEKGAQTCAGYSGGPLLIEQGSAEHVAGIVSYGDEACVEQSFDTRIDVELPWILRTMIWEEKFSES